jgi:hypothetical protein
MKMKIVKTQEFVIDLAPERERIKQAFKKKRDWETRDHLNELMDLIENQEWQKAYDLLDGDWWQGRDTIKECSRLEFIGTYTCIDGTKISFLDLVYNFVFSKKEWKVAETEREVQ